MSLFIVDAFTDRPFRGNQAAVCLLGEWPGNDWLQAVAAEMNLSETAFLVKQSEGYDLRWFTPKLEVDLCGHATLASAHVLWEQKLVDDQDSIVFHTRSGDLRAAQSDQLIELDFPSTPPQPVSAPDGLLEALGVSPRYVGRSKFDHLVEVESEAVLRATRPDFGRLIQVATRGTIVTSRSDDPQYDFVSRFFAPAAGVNEDPVTGSAHCCLGPYWREKTGKHDFMAYQASERGGILRVRVRGNRIYLGGRAVSIVEGKLRVPSDASDLSDPSDT